jgi:hypothetical protein
MSQTDFPAQDVDSAEGAQTATRTSVAWAPLCSGALIVSLGVAVFALVVGVRPAEGFVGDFTQDWLSARDVREGQPAYGDLHDALRRQFGSEPPTDFLRRNAHPPASVVLVLPLAELSHVDAFFAWNLITLALFACAVWVAAHELDIRPARRSAALAALVTALGTTCYPLFQQTVLGQFNCLLAFLITIAWAADRRGWWVLAGVAVGAATAVKLFPGFLLLYLFACRRWRALGAAVLTFLVANGAAVVVLGPDAFRTYVCEVIPSVSAEYATRWNNLSVSAYWKRLFDPAASSRAIPVVDAPMVGKILAPAGQSAVAVCVAVIAARARSTAQRDQSFAAAVVGMLLVSPLTWPHALVMLIVPVGVLVAHRPCGVRLWALVVCLAVLWLPDTFAPRLAFGVEEAGRMSVYHHQPLTLVGNLLVASVPHYALLGLFVLTLLRQDRRAESFSPSASVP